MSEQKLMKMNCATLKDDLKAIRKILKEIERTEETGGCYNPYNKVADWLAQTVSDTRQLLESRTR